MTRCSTFLLVSSCGFAQVADEANAKPVADIPVNHVEAKAGTYSLPDPLTMIGGKPVRDAKTWLNKRRPEIVRLFEENQFGRAPERPPLDKKKAFEVTEQSAPALNGKAYFMHDGGHGTIPSDWDVFVKFLETNLR